MFTNETVACRHPSGDEPRDAYGDDVIGRGEKDPAAEGDDGDENDGAFSTENVHQFAWKLRFISAVLRVTI